ncbi:MAG: hypothetical protein ACI4N3_03645 [Alphaproteobacteria bacterium]
MNYLNDPKWNNFKKEYKEQKKLKDLKKTIAEEINTNHMVLEEISNSCLFKYEIYNRMLKKRELLLKNFNEVSDELKKRPNTLKLFFETLKQK